MIHAQLLRLVSPRGGGIAAGVLAGIALSGLAVVQATAMARLFAGVLGGEGTAQLLAVIAILAAALLLRPLVVAVREVVAHTVASRMKRDMRKRILDHERALGPFASGRHRLGEGHSLLIDAAENLEPYVTRYIPQVIVTALTAVVTVTLLVRIDVVVGIVAGATAFLVPLAPRLWDRALRGRGEEHWDAYASLHADVVDATRGMETLKLLNAAKRRRAQLSRASSRLLRATMSQLRLSLAESGLTSCLLVAGPALALTVGVLRVSSGALEANALFAVTLIGFEVFRPFRELAGHWHAGYLGLTAGSTLLERLQAPVPRPAPTRGRAPAGIALDLEDVTARYPGARGVAIEGCSLRIEGGTFTAIAGPSGAGKSTLANIILGLLTPERGRVRVAPGQQIALVSQDPVLFSGTVRENLALVAADSDDDVLRAALDKAQAGDLGLDDVVGAGGALLSGGQRQRVAVARALLSGASVLLLDEASSALDGRRERALLTGLRRTVCSDGLTLIVIAHRLDAIRDADRIVVVDDAKVVGDGTYDELVASGGVFARMHEAAQAARTIG